MTPPAVLVANRGEIAVRILRAAAELGMPTATVYSRDDARCLHVRRADTALALPGAGPRAYLDVEAVLAAAAESNSGLLHPGYGFLSESPELARRCAEAGLRFVGPGPEVLAQLGDKAEARALAARCGVPVLRGSTGRCDVDGARALLESLGPGGAIVVKAVAGGGGRGMRIVTDAAALPAAFERCRSEAQAAFGDGSLYAEELLARARHVEVQVVGDGREVMALGERECTLQRRHQKLVELAPSPGLAEKTRAALFDAALRMARELRLASLCTFEFLLDAEAPEEAPRWAFIEANPRLQVEHTVTEAVTGLDLVQLQLRLATGDSLRDVGLDPGVPPAVRGSALQARVNLERVGEDGELRPSGGTLRVFEPPAGAGVRVETHAYAGYTPPPAFDSLLAKVVVHSPSSEHARATGLAYRALCELRVEGAETNLPFLKNLLRHPEVAAHRVTTRFVEEHWADLARDRGEHPQRFFEPAEAPTAAGLAGARVDRGDPLAVLELGRTGSTAAAREAAPEGQVAVPAPLQGTVVSLAVAEGDAVAEGAPLLVMEAMKMEHEVRAPVSGTLRRMAVSVGDTLLEGHALAWIEPGDVAAAEGGALSEADLDAIRPDLAEALERHRFGLDEARPEAVERRRRTGQRTARANVEDLCDPGSFREYGALVIAAQRRRRELDDLIRRTPGDGMVCGLGRVNGALFGEERSRCVVMSYDYTVLAGTQGLQNHRKKDRLFEIARTQRLPVVLFTEGGGGRPGDTDGSGVAGLDCLAFRYFGELSGLVPLVGINSGRCFAGNAALLGCCDVIIATRDSNIGMGGPAMIEGGGLGVFRPEEVGPIADQLPNGVVDIAVEDEAEAVAVARRYLAYFQGRLPEVSWACDDQRRLRHVIPENRLRVYDVRRVIETLVDTGSALELRRAFGPGMVTALARVEGRAIGIVANDPTHLGGAIDPEGADKAARFMQLCDAFDLPILFLCDTPGIMVGPEIEKRAMVRHAARMFVVGGSLSVPFFTIVLRKGYGLGAQAMAGGSFHAPVFTVAWPTGEFGGMGLEGAVKLGFRKELAAVTDPAERRALFEQMVARMYEVGKAVNMASHFEIDDVIDPAESRGWIAAALEAAPPPAPRSGKKRPCVDTW